MEILLLLLGAIGHMVLWGGTHQSRSCVRDSTQVDQLADHIFPGDAVLRPDCRRGRALFRLEDDSVAVLIAAGIAWGYVIICAGLTAISATQATDVDSALRACCVSRDKPHAAHPASS